MEEHLLGTPQIKRYTFRKNGRCPCLG